MLGVAGNRRIFWFAPYLGSEQTQDEYGNTNGVHAVYGNPVECKANISAGGGRYAHSMFGNYADYTHTVGPLPKDCAMNEDAVLWIDTIPVIGSDGSTDTPHDYVVKRVSASLTHKNYAVQRVNVGG